MSYEAWLERLYAHCLLRGWPQPAEAETWVLSALHLAPEAAARVLALRRGRLAHEGADAERRLGFRPHYPVLD